MMKKKVINMEYEVAALKVVLKSLLLTLTPKQKQLVIQDIKKTINDASSIYPHCQDVINKTEQYVKKML